GAPVAVSRQCAAGGWRGVLGWRAPTTPVSPLSRMARIAIIALWLFAAARPRPQQPDPSARAAPADTTAKPPSAGNDAQSPPAATTPAPPADRNATPPPATADAPPAAPPAPAPAGNVDVRESLCLMIESAARRQNLPLEL